MWRRFIFAYIAAFIVVADQLTKEWIRNVLAPGQSFPEFFHIVIIHLQNTGAAFGIFTDRSFILTIVALVGIVVIFIFYRRVGTTSLLGSIALGMVFGGALGNLVDRIRLGYVTDFFYVRLWGDVFWPAFNVADSCISVGMILLVWFMLREILKKDESKK